MWPPSQIAGVRMGPRDTEYDAEDRGAQHAAAINAAHDRQDSRRGEAGGTEKRTPVDACRKLCGLIELDLAVLDDPLVTPYGIEAAIARIEQNASAAAATIKGLRAARAAANDTAPAPGAAA
jgi:hypothetical protein